MSAGHSVFSCSAACLAAFGSTPRDEGVWFRSGSAGAPDCRGQTVRLGSVRVSWGGLPSSLPWDWHRVLRFVIARGGGCDYMWPIIRCSRGDGMACREPTHHSVADVSPRWGGQASTGALELRPSGARQQPARVKQGAQQHKQDHHRERGRHHDHEACGTEAHQRCDPPPFEAEQRNHSGRRHLPDRIMSRRCRDARFRSGYLGPVGDSGSTVTSRNSDNTQH